jgi:hypothetical protein
MRTRRLSWAQLIKGGVPPLFVLRPHPAGFTPSNIGDEYPAPDPANRVQLTRARQMYEQGRRIGTREELELIVGKPIPAPLRPGKEKRHGPRSS